MLQEPMINGAEQDCFTRWRKWLCYLQRPGVAKKIKRGYNKRVRHKAKLKLREEITS